MTLKRHWQIFIVLLMQNWISAQDTIPPIFINPPQSASYPCGLVSSVTDSLTNWYQQFGGATASDNSGVVSIQANQTLTEVLTAFAGSSQTLCGRTQQVSVIFTPVDSAGNSGQAVEVVFATFDSLAPDASGGKSVTFNCVEGIRDTLIQWIRNKGGYTATDACSDSIQWSSYLYLILSGNDTISQGGGNIISGPYPAIPDSVCQWVLKASFIASDECGNMTATPATTTFTVKDSLPPVFLLLPQDVTVQCDDRLAIPPVTAIDYCDRSVPVRFSFTTTQSPNIRSCAHTNYEVQRVWTASDACGNTIQHTQKITVRDTIPPVFSGAGDITVSCATFYRYPDSLYVRVTDNCSIIASATYKDTILSTGCTSVIRRVYTAADVCGNTSMFTQRLHIAQDQAPVFIRQAKEEGYACSDIQNLDALLAIWVNNRAGAEAKSSCNAVSSFAAVKGSYTLNDPKTWPGIAPTSLPKTNCPSLLKGYIRFLEVDFVFYDTCGNAAVTTAIFGVTDTLGPIISDCPNPIQINTENDQCASPLLFSIPEATDNCSEPSSIVRRTVIAKITSPQPAGFKTVVDTAYLRLGPVNPNTVDALSDGTLAITLRNMDMDGSKEYFTIYSENGKAISNTPTGAGECESTTFSLSIPKDSVQAWIRDGYIDLVFAPHTENIDSIFFINNICGNSQIEATMSFESAAQNGLKRDLLVDGELVYENLDTSNVRLLLQKGKHFVGVRYTDCALNTSVCNVQVTVADQTPPAITCPPALTVSLPTGQCADTINLATNWTINENCDGKRRFEGWAPSTFDASKISFLFRESNGWFEAQSSQMVFRQVFDIRYVKADVQLDVVFYGDNGGPSKRFELIGPDGTKIGKTAIGEEGKCGLVQTTFFIAADKVNSWIKNGEVTIVAVPETGENGIRPCGSLLPGSNTDGVSFIQAKLSYTDALFEIASAGATVFPFKQIDTDGGTTPLVLNGGSNVMTLKTSDGSGNEANCRFEIIVADKEKPVSRCKKALVQLDPSGLTPAIVTPDLIDNGSTDNCAIASMKVIPSEFDCSLAGTDVEALLVVTDKAENHDTCKTTVKVKAYELKPSYSSGLCANDTLKLFANLPEASIPGTYTFFWDGPGNLDFFTEDVLIPNVSEAYNGVYLLTIKGFNDCTSTGSVLVNVKPLIKPDLLVSDSEICENSEILLTCTQYSGDIEYQWYQGAPPSGVLLKKTQTPDLMVRPAVLGANFFYVIARGPQCSSNPSVPRRVDVLKTPTASVNDLFLSPCEGDDIVLGTPVTNQNFTYHWTGPAGYNETGKDPAIIKNVTGTNAGNYYLVIRNKECVSDTAVTRVVIAERPAQPSIISADIFCEGATFSMVAIGSANAERYEWRKDNAVFTVTQDNSLIIPNAQSILQGSWQVIAIKGNCRSSASAARFIAIDNSLEVGAINSGPICAGDSVRLQATFVPNATYQWEGPAGLIPAVYNPKINGVAGDYSVTITTPTGCQNKAATVVTVIPVPEITALSNDAKTCMRPNSVIRFYPSVFPAGTDYNYVWQGPNMFSANTPAPVLTTLTPQDTGLYTLIVYNKGCPSKPVQTRVAFTIIPTTPVISTQPFYCTGDTLRLSVQGNTGQYTWQTPVGQIETSKPELVIPQAAFIHAGEYTVMSMLGVCMSDPSTAVSILVKPRPAMPELTSNSPVCFGDTLIISVKQPAQVSYQWNGPVPTSEKSGRIELVNATKAMQGSWLVTAEKDGCQSPPSQPLVIKVKDEIPVPTFEKDLIAICQDRNNGAEVCFKPSSLLPGAIYTLVNSKNEDTLAIGSASCLLVTETNKLSAGANFITASASFDGCVSVKSIPIVINISVPPAIVAAAVTDDLISCPGETVQLISRDGPPLVQVGWTSPDKDVRISNPAAIAPLFSGFKPGENTVFLSYSIQGCPDFSLDTVRIYVEFEPAAMDDLYSLPTGQKSVLPVLVNDTLPPGARLILISKPEHGILTLTGNTLSFQPDPRYLQNQTFVYKLCADQCSDLCDEARVTLQFNEEIACQTPNIFTPNADGINDAFVVPCLSTGNFPANELVVFNEWGKEVYRSKPYANDWEGTYAGESLPVGTYYYLLDLGNGGLPITNFLVLQR